MTRRTYLVIIIAALGFGCGSTASGPSPTTPETTPVDPAVAAAQAKGEAIRAAKPKEPYGPPERTAFRPGERCGQGPYRFEVPALASEYGEKLEVYTCGPRGIEGNVAFEIIYPDGRHDAAQQSFGDWYGDTNHACVATAADRTAKAEKAPGHTTSAETGGHESAAAATDPATAPARSLVKVSHAPADCDAKVSMMSYGWTTTRGAPLPEGTRFSFTVWSNKPADLDGVLFVAGQRGVAADMTDDKWAAYLDAYDDWYHRYRAFLDGELAAGRSHIVDTTPKAPPPPAKKTEVPPPRPSTNAHWIAGYWFYEDDDFHWISGFWRVPKADVKAGLTARAPHAPPPRQTETQQPERPARQAVWTPGYWQWNGRAYVWVNGAWRLPPSPKSTWKPAGWIITSVGSAVFSPGGWSVGVSFGG